MVRVERGAGSSRSPPESAVCIAGAIDVRDEHGRWLRYRETGPGRIEIPLGRDETAVVAPRG
ncbi:hypothetical protein, partial [Streptomyces sp. PRh5]|uniref:hypothetical protein n=1 Tax=Streptomyces sp. PRh5 TaxID=1158056 RepID=UPI0019D71972